MPLPQLVMFLGGMGGSPVEEEFASALGEDALDTLERVLDSGGVDGAILATDRPQIAQHFSSEVRVDVDDGPFHFGERLAEVVRRHGLERLIYLGAGSGTLMANDDFFSLGHYLGMAWNTVLTNNRYSSDFAAFVPGQALFRIPLPTKDNVLPRVLHDSAGLTLQELPRSTANQFNIDTPSDLAVLKLTGHVGPRLHEWLGKTKIDISVYEACLGLLTSPRAQILVAGRVGSQVWQYLEKEAACKVRLVSEERGLRAEGREDGKARSLLGYHLKHVGCERFFKELAEMADGAFIDTRILLAHLALQPSRADRFLSDLGRYDEISDPFLHEFTEEAVKAPIPVLLGGHSLVAGGLMALTEIAWREVGEPPP